MARLKKKVTHYDEAVARLSAIKSIDARLDLGAGIDLVTYEKKINDLRDKLNAYNTLLSQVDAHLNDILAGEKDLRDFSERVLMGVATRYGKDSNEYEQAGGKRKSERKKPAKKKVE